MKTTCSTPRPARPRGAVGRAGLLLPILAVLLIGAGPPELVRRVRVPAAKVPTWFPPGTSLRGMPAEEFDALVRAATEGAARRVAPAAPRALRARHSARWQDGVLVGRSEFIVEPPASGVGRVDLEPWAPAIVPPEGGASPIRVDPAGRLGLRVDAGSTANLALDWHLRASPGSDGRSFRMAFPEIEPTSLALELPEGLVPDGPEGIREGPFPGSAGGKSAWKFDIRGGRFDLRLLDQGEPGGAREGERLWVGGPTRVELRGALATWRVEWTVEAPAHGPRQLDVELGPGLDLIEASGPGVEGFRPGGEGAPNRVAIALARGASKTLPVVVRGVAKLPLEGAWAVPAARPLNAVWTGGATTVVLDGSHVLQECRETAGRRVSRRASGSAESSSLVFEAAEPGSVADLVFSKPRAQASADVRGRLLLGNSAPRLQCTLTWRVDSGRLLDLGVDLPPAWIPDRIEIGDRAQPATWHSEARPEGGTRVHVVPPLGEGSKEALVVNLSATATIAGGRGPLALPRVRPVGVPVSDEVWVALAEPGMTLRPVEARGIAWLDPALAPGPDPVNFPDGRSALSWRWTVEDAKARVDRDRLAADPGGTVQLMATVESGRLAMDWRISLRAEGPSPATIALHSADDAPDDVDWGFRDEETGVEIAVRPIEAARRSALGFPAGGSAWELDLPGPARGRWDLIARRSILWSGRGRIPVLSLPPSFHARGMIQVLVDRATKTSVESEGLWRLALDLASGGVRKGAGAEADSRAGREPGAYRVAHAFGYSEPGGRLELETEALTPLATGAVIREAVLTTFCEPGRAGRQHLSLAVAPGEARAIEFSLPEGAILERAWRDGQAVAPSRVEEGDRLSVDLTGDSGPGAPIRIGLEYRTEAPARRGGGRLIPEPPTFASPCLGFVWQVVTPSSLRIVEQGPALIAADPPAPLSWGDSILEAWKGVVPATRPSSGERDAVILQSVDALIEGGRPREVSLEEWLTRWDGGPWPVVVDRMALAAAGIGPRKRFVPAPVGPGRPGAANASLAPLGLVAIPVGDFLLITTSSEAAARDGGRSSQSAADPWNLALRKGAVWGSDGSDRFQSVARWRGDLAPPAGPPGQATTLDAMEGGWRVHRFASAGWPTRGAYLRVADDRTRAAWASLVGLGIFLAGLLLASRSAALRGALVAAAVSPFVAASLLEKGDPWLAAGAAAGAGASAAYWLGRALRRPREEVAPLTAPSSSVRFRVEIPPAAVGPLLVALTLAPTAAAQAGLSAPILALFPYDGLPDPDSRPDRVLIRLEDYTRLRRMAGAPAPQPAGPSATSATHRVSWQGSRELLVLSELDLVGGEGPAPWRFPIGSARDLSATLDGDEVPVFIEEGGGGASVQVPGGGPHRLEVRRVAPAQAVSGGLRLSLPVNRIASARFAVAAPSRSPRPEILGARGRVAPAESGIEGGLGPCDRLEVVWPSARAEAPPAPRGMVDGLILWDAEPAGDRVRMRLTYRDAEGTSSLRFALEPGLILRDAAIPGLVNPRWEGTAEAPVWAAGIDPPLPDGATIGLTFWRPATRSARPDGDAPPEAGRPLPRPLPKVEPLGVERYTGALGFRRPADWTGRLLTAPGASPISDESFVKLWGNLPDEPLTLSGTTRFTRAPDVSLPTGPIPERVSAEPSLQLVIGPGRIDFALETHLIDHDLTSHAALLEVPADLRLIRVEGEGLTDWSRPAPDRVRFRFDGRELGRRRILVRGWLPVATDPLATAEPNGEAQVPWPRWLAAEVKSGTLDISSPTPFQLAPAPGLTVIGSEQRGGDSSTDVRFRTSYRVERAGGLGRLSWTLPSSRAGVTVQSQLTVYPDMAEWVAVLSYEVSGGPYDAIHLQLPAPWAARAQVKSSGEEYQLTSEARHDVTRLLIRPDPPIWGNRRLVVRSTLPLDGKGELNFPDLIPLGKGSAETTLAIVNATGRPLQPEISPGLVASDGSAFRGAEFRGLGEFPTRAYSVRKEGWTLRIPLAEGHRPALGEGTPLADLAVTLGADGSALGMARYELAASGLPFLPIVVPPRCEALWATVDGRGTVPLMDSEGDWFIPLKGTKWARVELGWRTGPVDERLVGSRPLLLPSPPKDGTPLFNAGATTFVTSFAPPHIDVKSTTGAFERVAPDRREIEGAEALARRIVKRLPALDRTSRADLDALAASLDEFDAMLRRAGRAAQWEPVATRSLREERVRRVRERVRVARSALRETLQAADLGGLVRDLGSPPDGPDALSNFASTAASAPAEAPLRIPLLGKPTDYYSETGDRGPASSIAWVATPKPGFAERPGDWGVVALALLAPPLAYAGLRRAASAGRWGLAALGAALAVLAALGGPWTLAGGLVLAWLGWSAAE